MVSLNCGCSVCWSRSGVIALQDHGERVWFRNRALFHLRRLKDPLRRAESLGAWAAFALFDAHSERLAGLDEALDAYSGAGPAAQDGLEDAEILERVAGR